MECRGLRVERSGELGAERHQLRAFNSQLFPILPVFYFSKNILFHQWLKLLPPTNSRRIEFGGIASLGIPKKEDRNLINLLASVYCGSCG